MRRTPTRLDLLRLAARSLLEQSFLLLTKFAMPSPQLCKLKRALFCHYRHINVRNKVGNTLACLVKSQTELNI